MRSSSVSERLPGEKRGWMWASLGASSDSGPPCDSVSSRRWSCGWRQQVGGDAGDALERRADAFRGRGRRLGGALRVVERQADAGGGLRIALAHREVDQVVVAP